MHAGAGVLPLLLRVGPLFTAIALGQVHDDAHIKGLVAGNQQHQQQDVVVASSTSVPQLLTADIDGVGGSKCDLTGVWRGHPGPGRITAPIIVRQRAGSRNFTAKYPSSRGCKPSADICSGTLAADGRSLRWDGITGVVSANTAVNASAPQCTRISWAVLGELDQREPAWWCKEPWCDWLPPPPPPPSPPLPVPRPAPPKLPPRGAMNVLFIAVDDLRAQFGRSFKTPEVLTPNIDRFFIDGGGSAMQHSYVQIAVCGPSRSSMLTGRRPDTTHVGTGGSAGGNGGRGSWCWCSRSGCSGDALFMTLPTYMRQQGFVTAGNGKLFHPDACDGEGGGRPNTKLPAFSHVNGDDPRAWSYGEYGVEADEGQEQFGCIASECSTRLSFAESALADDEETDGLLATNTVERLANFSRDGIGKPGVNWPFFLSTGFHKPHLPQIVPKKYFDLYNPANISVAPNPQVPAGFKEENFHADGTWELKSYSNANAAFSKDQQSFRTPVDASFARAQRRAYFAATSFTDANVGRVTDALAKEGYKDNTIVLLWGDHGWHLGDTNSWGKMTNFESGTRNAMLWRVPGQRTASQGLNGRFVESIDIFPTLIQLTGVAAIPKCKNVDDPPTTQCLQGQSYATEFLTSEGEASPPLHYAFSQWPFSPWGPNATAGLREGYSVRSAKGYRYTTYVSYNATECSGDWTAPRGDEELYDYNVDPWETVNRAGNATYVAVLAELRAVLRRQYTAAPSA
jgi:arylsulfatase A-like enzyme